MNGYNPGDRSNVPVLTTNPPGPPTRIGEHDYAERKAPNARILGPFIIAPNAPVGTQIISQLELGFYARALVFINTSGIVFSIDSMKGWLVPAGCNQHTIRCEAAVGWLQVSVVTASATGGLLWCLATEEELTPSETSLASGGGGGGAVTITGPVGQAVMAASIPVVIASNQTAVPVSLASQPQAVGAAHHIGGVVTIAGGVGTLAARATRTGGYIRARKANVADLVVDGTHLQPGDALNLTAVDVYSLTGTNGDIFDTYEEYN